MKRTQLLVLSALVAGLQIAVAQASVFPADAEASHDLPALETYADRMARIGNGGNGDAGLEETFPVSISNELEAPDTYADRIAREGDTGSQVWGVSPRQPYSPFPSSVSEVD